MAQSLYTLNTEKFGKTKYDYVKASARGESQSKSVEYEVGRALGASAASLVGGGGAFGAGRIAGSVFKTVQASSVPASNNTSSLINVCDDFAWNISPNFNTSSGKRLTPRAIINEYRVEDTAVLAAILYAAEGAVAAGEQPANQLSRIAERAGLKSIANGVDAGAAAVGSVTKAANEEVRQLGGINKNLNFPDSAWMQPFKDLYSLKATDFKYLLPYLDDAAFNEVSNAWPDLTYPLQSSISQMADTVTNIAKIAAPGQYIEKPKMYDPASSSTPSLTFKFPLFNTQSYENACSNYQLLWLLIFQNTPQRVTKSLLEMPKIYSVNAPGICYMQYSFIERLSINFLGNRRHVDISMPNNSIGLPTTIPAIMPDAYEITITFRSLNIHNGNMLLEMWKQSTSQNVSF